MIHFTTGNLLEAQAEALVNTVNTVGVMGKGIALMFKEAFPENFKTYAEACKRGDVQTGRMFVTERRSVLGPRWIINFPTKKSWLHPSRMEWIVEGLEDLKKVITEREIHSIALPPLGAGNGGLEWSAVREVIEKSLQDLPDVDFIVYEPTAKYQNVAKREGVRELTPARVLVAELVRRYWILGIECSLLEIQKLAWFLERVIERHGPDNPLNLQFKANRYGPYSDRLMHLLNALDGSYLHCDKRLRDAAPTDVVWFEDSQKERVQVYLNSEAKAYQSVLDITARIIDGFESPLGLELLATVDWLLVRESREPTIDGIKQGLKKWSGGAGSARRKLQLFDDRLIGLAIKRLSEVSI